MTRADRTIMAIAGGLFAALAFVSLLAAPVSEAGFTPVPSTYLSTPGGALAAYLLLQRLGVQVQRWEEPPLRLVAEAPDAVLIIAEPSESPSRGERRALKHFAEEGGRILFCGGEFSRFFPEVQIEKLVPGLDGQVPDLSAMPPEPQQYAPVDAAPGSEAIELRAQAKWRRFQESQAPVYGDSHNAVVAVWSVGKGEVVWWAGATPLTNSGLQRASNLELFLRSVRADSGRHTYWDEYFHGERGSLWDYVGRVPAIRWALIQLAALAGACLFAFGRRSGPVIAPVKISRLSPLEFVDSLGNLYRKAKAASVAVNVTLQQFRLQLSRRLALPVTISDEELASAAANRLGWNQSELHRVFSQSSGATRNSASPALALELVQAIQRFTARLNDPGTKKY